MSLRFIYDETPKIRFIRVQRIKFIASKPVIHITLGSKKESPSKFSYTLKLSSFSLQGCYELVNSIKDNSLYSQLYNLSEKSSECQEMVFSLFQRLLDFRYICDKMSRGEYQTVEEVKEELKLFVDGVYNRFVQLNYSSIRNAAFFIKEDIENAFRNCPKEQVIYGSKDIDKIRSDLTRLNVPEPEYLPTTQYDLEKIANALNHLDKNQRQKAEWIIRMKSPRVAYYQRAVDISELPYTAIDSLIEEFKIY